MMGTVFSRLSLAKVCSVAFSAGIALSTVAVAQPGALPELFPTAETPMGQPVAQRPYHIGNSLTYNQVAFDWVGFMAAQRGYTHGRGYHVRWGTSMSGIRANFEATRSYSASLGGTFDNALGSGNYSSLVLQPFFGSVDDEILAARQFIAQTQRFDLPVYVYQTWTARVDAAGELSSTVPFSYGWNWLEPYTNPAAAPGFATSRAYFQSFARELRRIEGDRPIRVIPVGEVFFNIESLIEMGQIPEMTSILNLYQDPIHVNQLGAYVAALTMYAVMYNDDPRGLGYPIQIADRMTPTLSAQLQEIVWNTLGGSFPFTNIPSPGAAALLGIGGLVASRRRR